MRNHIFVATGLAFFSIAVLMMLLKHSGVSWSLIEGVCLGLLYKTARYDTSENKAIRLSSITSLVILSISGMMWLAHLNFLAYGIAISIAVGLTVCLAAKVEKMICCDKDDDGMELHIYDHKHKIKSPDR